VFALDLAEVLPKHVAVAAQPAGRLEASNLLHLVHHRPDLDGLVSRLALLRDVIDAVLNEAGKRESAHPPRDKQGEHEGASALGAEVRARPSTKPAEDARVDLGGVVAGRISGQQFFDVTFALSEVFEQVVERERADARISG